LLFGLFVAMLYLATQRVSWLVIGGVMFVVGAFFAIGAFPHVMARIEVWLNAMDPVLYDRVGGSFQLVQGLFGMANGGLLGTGWGRGFPYLVPLSFSDFIFPALGEEIGLTGLLAVLVVFMIIVERGLRTALGVRDGFGKLLAAGLSFLFALQLFTIIGGVTRLLPLTGLTVPFMAQGGSSMMANWIVVALLLRISDAARRPSHDPGIGEVASQREPTEKLVEVPGRSVISNVTNVPVEVAVSGDGPATEFIQLDNGPEYASSLGGEIPTETFGAETFSSDSFQSGPHHIEPFHVETFPAGGRNE
ncbi:MAG: FtsW/RodA/SpoVE family cell cycle protein, partial [Cellulomonadaceae bacterium]|nr:FtsW/RodA/SpoVE family cell cycle protein [Cellulomonadaceae bacterium]